MLRPTGEGGKMEPVQEEDSSPEVRKEAALQVVAGRNSEGVCVCVGGGRSHLNTLPSL